MEIKLNRERERNEVVTAQHNNNTAHLDSVSAAVVSRLGSYLRIPIVSDKLVLSLINVLHLLEVASLGIVFNITVLAAVLRGLISGESW